MAVERALSIQTVRLDESERRLQIFNFWLQTDLKRREWDSRRLQASRQVSFSEDLCVETDAGVGVIGMSKIGPARSCLRTTASSEATHKGTTESEKTDNTATATAESDGREEVGEEYTAEMEAMESRHAHMVSQLVCMQGAVVALQGQLQNREEKIRCLSEQLTEARRDFHVTKMALTTSEQMNNVHSSAFNFDSANRCSKCALVGNILETKNRKIVVLEDQIEQLSYQIRTDIFSVKSRRNGDA